MLVHVHEQKTDKVVYINMDYISIIYPDDCQIFVKDFGWFNVSNEDILRIFEYYDKKLK